MSNYIVSEENIIKFTLDLIEDAPKLMKKFGDEAIKNIIKDFFKSKQPVELVAELCRTDYLTPDESEHIIESILNNAGKCQNIKIYIQKEKK